MRVYAFRPGGPEGSLWSRLRVAHLAVTANRPGAHSSGRSQKLAEQRSPNATAQGPQVGHRAAGL